MDQGEFKFREAERFLDAGVRGAQLQMQALGVNVLDRSLRKHERGEYLCWSFEFTRTWELELESAQVRVSLSCSEPAALSDPLEVRVWRCAEQFRPGQISRVREVAETVLPVQALAGMGLKEVVEAEIRRGAEVLGHAP